MILTKTLSQLADEASQLTTQKERENFIWSNFLDIMDLATASNKELKELKKEVKEDAGEF